MFAFYYDSLIGLVYLHPDVYMGQPAVVNKSFSCNNAHFNLSNFVMENITPLHCQRTFIEEVEQLKEVRIVRVSGGVRPRMCALRSQDCQGVEWCASSQVCSEKLGLSECRVVCVLSCVLCFGSVNFCDVLNQIFYIGTASKAHIILVLFKVSGYSIRQTKEFARAHRRVFAHRPEEKGEKPGAVGGNDGGLHDS
jgi:hypothetical protein